jgi:hypothetical protein
LVNDSISRLVVDDVPTSSLSDLCTFAAVNHVD